VISEFERRLADVLGTRLPAPFAGRVDVPPGVLPGVGPVILLGATHVETLEAHLGSQRLETVPGVTDPRRVLRLTCEVCLQVFPAPDQGRPQQMQCIDAIMYTLDAPDFRSGKVLTGLPDPGFLIQSMQVVASNITLNPAAPTASPVDVILRADGWFWPVGVPGQAGIAIGEIRLRGVMLPLHVSPANPLLVAGGSAIDLTVQVGSFGVSRLHEPPIPPLPFGTLAFAVIGPGGRPGKGSLVDQADGVRIVPLTDNQAIVTYQLPVEAAEDELLIALDNGTNGLGIEIGRFRLRVRGP
jgi:hypothetical protein